MTRRSPEQIAADEFELQRLRAQIACHRVIDILQPIAEEADDLEIVLVAVRDALTEARKGVQE